MVRKRLFNPRNVMREMARMLAEEVKRQAELNLLSMATNPTKARAIREDLSIRFLPGVSEEEVKAIVKTDFYWAVYYHDGRGPMKARPGKYLVFYANPTQDPRTFGGTSYPKRHKDYRPLRLSKSVFRQKLKNKEIFAVKRVGPAEPHPFFERQMGLVTVRAGEKIADLFGLRVVEGLHKDDLWLPKEEIAEVEL
jgi:hypothetical protein